MDNPTHAMYSETSNKGHSLKEDKPPNKKQAESTRVYTLYRKSPLKEENLSIKDTKVQGLQVFHMRKMTSICEDCEKYTKMTIIEAQNYQQFYQIVT